MNVKFLIPLGLLGLLGIVALILIYIIKPNFQQKLLSSTFLWRLSLKFKKKKIPLSRLRNILLIACQVLIITAIAAILAKTIHVLKEKATQPEVVLVIDSSASMRAGTEESTRYERAVEAAVRQAGETFDRDGIVSVILAGNDNRFLVERAYADSRDSVVGTRLTVLWICSGRHSRIATGTHNSTRYFLGHRCSSHRRTQIGRTIHPAASAIEINRVILMLLRDSPQSCGAATPLPLPSVFSLR